MMDLNSIWFLLIGVLLTGYAILDGFDLGVGALHLFTRGEADRRTLINAIAPVWDGNEVWLLTGGGALFAAFPAVYATVFSGFYLALVLLLLALIFRAVAMEFRGKVDSPGWRTFWDWSFGLGSALPALLLGVAFGNILRGIPIDAAGTFTGSFFGLLNPYAVLIGLLSLTLFSMHGATYLTVKTDGDLRKQMTGYASRLWMAFILLYIIATAYSLLEAPFLFRDLLGNPIFWVFFILFLAAGLLHPVALKGEKFFRAFLLSCIMVAGTIGLSAVSLFPLLVPSITDLAYSLTIYNASSTQGTLSVMLIIALIGMPFVIAYTWFIYRAFKGKVILGPDSY
ncbi:MAG: cytochrome d ubiquinol oxidase subunit II [Bacteroidota bacterium]